MEFMLWAALSLHIFSVVIWLGSLCFLSAIVYPVLEVEGLNDSNLAEHIHRRMMPFLWLSLWTIGITGVALYIFSPEFLYGRVRIDWFVPVHGKVVLFIFIVIFSMRTRALYALYRGSKEGRSGYLRRIARGIRLTILFGILSLLLSAWESITKLIS